MSESGEMTKNLLLLANRLSSGGSTRHRCHYRQSRRGKVVFAVFSPRAAAAVVAGSDANDGATILRSLA